MPALKPRINYEPEGKQLIYTPSFYKNYCLHHMPGAGRSTEPRRTARSTAYMKTIPNTTEAARIKLKAHNMRVSSRVLVRKMVQP